LSFSKNEKGRSFVCKNFYKFFEANHSLLILAHHGVSIKGFFEKKKLKKLNFKNSKYSKKNPCIFFQEIFSIQKFETFKIFKQLKSLINENFFFAKKEMNLIKIF